MQTKAFNGLAQVGSALLHSSDLRQKEPPRVAVVFQPETQSGQVYSRPELNLQPTNPDD